MLAVLQGIVGVIVATLRDGHESEPVNYKEQFEPMLRELESLHQECLSALDELQQMAGAQLTEAQLAAWVKNRPIRQGAVIHLVEALMRVQKDRKLRARVSPQARRFLDAVCDYLGFPVLNSRYTFIRSLIRFETWLSFGAPPPRLVARHAAEMARDLKAGWSDICEQYARVRGEVATR